MKIDFLHAMRKFCVSQGQKNPTPERVGVRHVNPKEMRKRSYVEQTLEPAEGLLVIKSMP